MNKKQRYGTFAGAMFAAALVATLALVPAMDQQAFAKKPLTNYDDAERLIGINYIGFPKGDSSAPEGQCETNNSKNVYTVRGSGGQHIHWVNTDSSYVQDHCTEKVDGDKATIKVDSEDLDPELVFYTVRMLGKPGGEFKFCKELLEDFQGGDHCVIGFDQTFTFNRNGGGPTFSAPTQLFGDLGEDVVWHSQTNQDFRIAQIDVWYIPAA